MGSAKSGSKPTPKPSTSGKSGNIGGIGPSKAKVGK